MNERERMCGEVQRMVGKLIGSFSSRQGRHACIAVHDLATEIALNAQRPETGTALFQLASACEKLAVSAALPLP